MFYLLSLFGQKRMFSAWKNYVGPKPIDCPEPGLGLRSRINIRGLDSLKVWTSQTRFEYRLQVKCSLQLSLCICALFVFFQKKQQKRRSVILFTHLMGCIAIIFMIRRVNSILFMIVHSLNEQYCTYVHDKTIEQYPLYDWLTYQTGLHLKRWSYLLPKIMTFFTV